MAESGRKHVRILKRAESGFHRYGEPFRCTYSTEIDVYESSAASGPHVWLKLTCDPRVLTEQDRGEAVAHLDEKGARALIARLDTWLDEIPGRWGRAKR